MIVHTIDLQFLGLSQVIACFVLTTGEHTILVDPGPASCLDVLDAGLSDLGLTRASITDVLLTHIHFDHAGAAWAFADAGATVHVHPLGERHLHDPARLWESAARIYGVDNMTLLWGEMRSIPTEQIRTWQHEELAQVGSFRVQAFHTPGHAKHHIAWQIDDALFLGDVGGIQIGDGPVEAPCPPPDIDVEAWTNSLNLLASLTDVNQAYRTHFGAVCRATLTAELLQTRQALLRWVDIAEHVLQLPKGEQDEAFLSRIAKERAEFPQAADSYALANPAHMSLGGLERYLAQRQK